MLTELSPLSVATRLQVKVKESRYRPGVAQRVPGSLRFPGFLTTAQDGGKGKAVSLQAWGGPEGSRKFKVPRFLDNSTGWW
jgi:hypothetical protein